jgi:CubicO group peptidase (beta-lactamase class C family)
MPVYSPHRRSARMSFNRLEAFIFEKMAETQLAGVGAAIVRGGEVVWSRGFGLRDVAHGLPATPNTLYGIASLTKSFTSAAILQHAEQGKLSLDDPVEKFIPEFALRGGSPSGCGTSCRTRRASRPWPTWKPCSITSPATGPPPGSRSPARPTC